MSIVMKITASGQISLPAETRRKWNTDRVVVTETIDGLLVRPFDPNAIERLRGKYKHLGGPSTDELRDAERRQDAAREDRRR
jgi:bifunctional DNA-binding transcriptional regulator/antitoxin component of YhaV-PrlF toxin-antitoxin module